MFTAFLRENFAVREGFLHTLWADGKSEFDKGQFAVMFSPSGSEGAMKAHYCKGSLELRRFLERLGVGGETIERIVETVKQERSASERLALAQSMIQMFLPIAERVEYALLKTLVGCRLGPRQDKGHQDYWGAWMNMIKEIEPECTPADLLSALKRLGFRGVLRLTKPGHDRYEGAAYSGNSNDDDPFFFTGSFNAVFTNEGLKYWDHVR